MSGMKMNKVLMSVLFLLLAFVVVGCNEDTHTFDDNRQESQNFLDQHTAGAVSAETKIMEETVHQGTELPIRFQQPTFLLAETSSLANDDSFTVPVGADISSNRGPVTLRDILKRLAVLKRMNVSWADDVDQLALVDVDIRAEDDYYQAIANILRQLDYFYDIEGNSIVVKYRDTKTFHIAMPFLSPQIDIAIGGDVLGSKEQEHKMKGRLSIETKQASETSFNAWANIEDNLTQILKIAAETEVEDSVDSDLAKLEGELGAAASDGTSKSGSDKSATEGAGQRTQNAGSLGYFLIDRPVGLVTVTAPRSLLIEIENYFDNLKKYIYRQISIEAKIIEVTLSEDNTTGIDWSNFLGGELENALTASVDFQKLNPFYKENGGQVNYPFTLMSTSFSLIVDAMKDQGHVEILSNPRLSVLNGQPAMITVGKDFRYIESIESKVDEGFITLTAETSSIVSGLGMSVVASILDGKEVVLNLTPVTSELMEEIKYEEIGNTGGKVGLPKVSIRELTTTVRVKSGEMLVVGGLIDSTSEFNEAKVVGAGDIPVFSNFFNRNGTKSHKRELIILLRPVIIN